MSFFISLIIVETLGLAFMLAVKSRAMADKARKANVEYSFASFWAEDKWTIVITYIVIALFMIIFGPALDPGVLLTKDKNFTFFFDLFTTKISVIYEIVILSIGATVGYSGMDLALRFFGRMNGLINNAIDYKTTITDTANGTADRPTPVK